jgi:two-component system, NtrC family, sensor kinase
MENRLEEIMLQVSQSPLIDAGQQAQAIRLVLDSVCSGLAIQRAGVWFFDQALSGIRCNLLIDRANNTETEDILLTEQDYPRYFAGLLKERAVVANDARSDPATSEFRDGYLIPLGVTSMLDVPIRHHGSMIGIICAEHTGPMRQWTADEVTFAGSLADLVGRAINARTSQDAQTELSKLNRELESRVEQRTAQLKMAQSQLVESEKMAALGGLVAGVAHEVNTPLGVAVTAVSLLQESIHGLQQRFDAGELDEPIFVAAMSEQHRTLALLEENLRRAANLVKSFKQTAVDQTADVRQIFDLRGLVERTLNAVHPATRKVCDEVALEMHAEFEFDSYPGALGQILTNLLMNTVRHAFAQHHADNQIRIDVAAADQPSRVRMTVTDNGAGIAPENLPRIFEPFFTTQRGQGGSGLGLSICYNLANQRLGGTLKVDSTRGSQTVFTLEIPIKAP